jgi:hypothetical protein
MRNLLRKFFSSGTISPPNALIWEKKIEQKRPVNPKNRGILAIWSVHQFLFALSLAQYWIFRRQAKSGNHFRSKGLKI